MLSSIRVSIGMNSFTFSSELNSINSSNKFMCSFDIKSLFTNIPLIETLEIIQIILFSNQTQFSVFKKDEFMSLLRLAVLDNIFIFNGYLYKQIDGVAMGSPLGPTLANIFLCYHEKKWLSDCPPEFKPLLYRRYVDDLFLLFDNEHQANSFLNYLNNKHHKIEFTFESETNNSLNFLDISINKHNQKFTTSIYRKPTFTGLGTNFFSFTPYIYKLNSIKTLIYRAYHISSSYLQFNQEINFLRKYFTDNLFPSHLIDSATKKFLNNIYQPKLTYHTVDKIHRFFKLSFYGQLSDVIGKEISQIISKFYPQLKLTLVFTNPFCINSFFQHKERLPENLVSSVVYCFKCPTCDGRYVGSTCRQLICRQDEHLGRSTRTKRPLASPPFSNIREHSQKNNHPISHKDFSIIAKCNNPIETRILESIYIKLTKPTINDSNSSFNLNIA